MQKTFDTVDEKIAEAEFFLRKMIEEKPFSLFEIQCYFSAFLSATRSSTLALQQFKHIPNFEEWYKPHQEKLKSNELAKFFLKARNEHLHGGRNPISGCSSSKGQNKYFFYDSNGHSKSFPKGEVISLSRNHFLSLLRIIYDCYIVLGVYIDPQQHYTKEHFFSMDRTIDDAEIEIFGWINSSLTEEGFTEDDRWHHLRRYVGQCKINHLFYSYLGKETPQPKEPEHYKDFEFTPREKGWLYIPAGFNSIEEYMKFIKNKE